MQQFGRPDFSQGVLEFRYENGEVCIYGTSEGLQRLSRYCLQLVEHPAEQHTHLESLGILTKKSLKGVLAIFEKE
jgi:hypothetical protein